MKKKFLIIAFSVVMCVAGLAGCGKSTEEKKEPVKEEKVEAEEVKEEEIVEEEVVEETVDPTEELIAQFTDGYWDMIPAQTKHFLKFNEDGTLYYYSGMCSFDEMMVQTTSYKIEGDVIYLNETPFKVGHSLSELTPDFIEGIEFMEECCDYQEGDMFLYEINYEYKKEIRPELPYYPEFVYKTQKDLDWL